MSGALTEYWIVERVDHPAVQFCFCGDGCIGKRTFFHTQTCGILGHSIRDVRRSLSLSFRNTFYDHAYFYSRFIGLFVPLPFWIVWKLARPNSLLARAMAFVNIPIIGLYMGWLVLWGCLNFANVPESWFIQASIFCQWPVVVMPCYRHIFAMVP